MKLIKINKEWHGQLNPQIPEESESIEILGTRFVLLPFTAQATEAEIREYFAATAGTHALE